ncbi:type II toxin-antitoxin system Phd/YefM family antitoxin [soil metagenome]
MRMEIQAGQFKARCLALLDEVAATGAEYVVTKRGKPVARLVPLEGSGLPDLAGSVRYANEADLLAPVPAAWEAGA